MTQILVQPVHCLTCGHTWELPMQNFPPVDMYVSIIKAAAKSGCPECGEGDDLTLLSTRSAHIGEAELEKK